MNKYDDSLNISIRMDSKLDVQFIVDLTNEKTTQRIKSMIQIMHLINVGCMRNLTEARINLAQIHTTLCDVIFEFDAHFIYSHFYQISHTCFIIYQLHHLYH